jgi:hypothetical protein
MEGGGWGRSSGLVSGYAKSMNPSILCQICLYVFVWGKRVINSYQGLKEISGPETFISKSQLCYSMSLQVYLNLELENGYL